MADYLYRFRSLERILSGELERQEIYFAKPEQLNDPAEGFRDVVWKGDTVLWENLFRHYTICLERAFLLFILSRPEEPVTWQHLPILNQQERDATEARLKMIDEIIATVLDTKPIRAMIEALALREVPTRRTELAAHLQSIHFFVISVVHKAYQKRGLAKANNEAASEPDWLDTVRKEEESMVELARLERDGAKPETLIETLFESQAHVRSELNLITLINDTNRAQNANRNFIFLTFCDEYVEQLETLLYPAWYATCFMTNHRNSSIWGSYGVNHTGICLKFKTEIINDKPTLRINRVRGWDSARGATRGWGSESLLPITYQPQLKPVDFFQSLGRLPIPVIRNSWYTDRKGNKSRADARIFESEADWRDGYWDAFFSDITRKLDDWKFEQEHRLIVYSHILNLDDPKLRVGHYDFQQLEGLIFGINTPLDKQIEIVLIVQKLCEAHKRNDFTFYQAYYSWRSGTIEAAPLSLLKFKRSQN
ncbi:MAG: DUF2971 domain-containing protein [Proteobacteria bacterium]|nr:DUF2971 domain-containing protein [Pseudomonadota bacterium]